MASLIVEIVAESSSLDRALSRTHANLSTANLALGTFAGNVAASFARMAVGAAGGLFEGTIGSAAHLVETMNRVNVVLGDSADKVIKDADRMADRYGYVKQQVLGAASSFSLMGQEMKLSQSASADLGIKLTKMASELTSFFDPKGDLPSMIHKLESGIAGQVRPLRELGIFMTADAVKAQAAQMGLKPGASGQLSEGDKIRARIAFIENSKAMQLATGDLERTLGSTENQTRKFWGTLANLGTSIGEQLNPAWNKLLTDFNSGLDSLKGYFNDNKSMVKGWGDSVVEAFNTVKIVWRNLPDVVEIAALGVNQKMEDSLAAIEAWATKVAVAIEKAFLTGAQKATDFFTKIQNATTMGVSGGAKFLEDAMKGGKAVFGGISNAFDAGVGKFSAVSDVALRPLRDLANATGGGVKGPSGKFMSVEEEINRMQGALSGAPKTFEGLSNYFKTFQDVAGEAAKAKPPDVSSGLIDQADKHLADTIAKNSDVTSKAIAAAQARIAARELKVIEAWVNADDAFLEAMDPKKGEFSREQWEPASDKFIRSWIGNMKTHKEQWIPATEEQSMAEAMRNKSKRDADQQAEKAKADDAVIGATGKHANALHDAASFVRNLAAQQYGGDDVQERQLTELQAIREADQKNADMMERLFNKYGMAVYG